MRLIVHAGLHKTGSTYLQQAMNDNRDALLARGVHYAKQAGSPAHHGIARDCLRRDFSSLAAMIEEARAKGCHTAILSSQELEAAIFDPLASGGIEQAAAAAGVEAVEWHFCLRDPGEYFGSLHAELRHHLYTDPAAMAVEILRDGMMLLMEPLPDRTGAPFWGFCFDHFRYISAFAAQTRYPVYLHDFRDRSPFPGWRLLERVGLLDGLRMLPGTEARNARAKPSEIQDGYCHQILRRLPDAATRQRLRPMIEDQVGRNMAAVDDYARAVRDLFAPGTAAALQIFACPGVEGHEPLRACA
jgi:hypothetical protein